MNPNVFRCLCIATSLLSCCERLLVAQSNQTRPKFEVTAVKRNLTGCSQGRGGGANPAPDRLRVTCISVKDLIQAAYGTFASGPVPNSRLLQVVGAPEWIENEMFDVNAKPASQASIDQMFGPMLQTLLEDRFGLQIHRETRELPVYLLTVDTKGAKLPATVPRTCVQFDPTHPPSQPQGAQPPVGLCGRTSVRQNSGVLTIEAFGIQMPQFAGVTLSVRAQLDRPVIDRTQLNGMFDIHLSFRPGLSLPTDGNINSGDVGPSIYTALRELGLRLSSGKGPVDVLVVDKISHPLEN